MSSPRKKAVFKAVEAKPVVPSCREERAHEAGEIFGRNVFGLGRDGASACPRTFTASWSRPFATASA